MSDKKRFPKNKVYQYHTNAVCMTVYHPMGDSIPVEARQEIEELVCKVAQEYKLLVDIALT
jgi:hypothetical protein